MRYSRFPLFQSHLDLAHTYWKQLLQPGDAAIDATCGNGHDTLALAESVLTDHDGWVWSLDVQQQALDKAHILLSSRLTPQKLERVSLLRQSHACFPVSIAEKSVKLIVYNLGYLPGGDKSATTVVESTLQSLEVAQTLVKPGGVISITCYPGHEEGALEQEALLKRVSSWAPQQWNCTLQQWLNRKRAPSLLLIQQSESF